MEWKNIIIIYGLILFISFMLGPTLSIVSHEIIYNITCHDGTVEWFNDSTIEVCGQENPLHQENKDWSDVNYLESFNLT